jgi:hypothetical protein
MVPAVRLWLKNRRRRPLARLGALDTKTGRLYLPTAQAKPVPDPGERRTLIPGTFAILVLAPN